MSIVVAVIIVICPRRWTSSSTTIANQNSSIISISSGAAISRSLPPVADIALDRIHGAAPAVLLARHFCVGRRNPLFHESEHRTNALEKRSCRETIPGRKLAPPKGTTSLPTGELRTSLLSLLAGRPLAFVRRILPCRRRLCLVFAVPSHARDTRGRIGLRGRRGICKGASRFGRDVFGAGVGVGVGVGGGTRCRAEVEGVGIDDDDDGDGDGYLEVEGAVVGNSKRGGHFQ
mmetsp:Transcript_1095/g.2086  ORF Transcript_1095/g.2086 Transcript_1095/m.2086 type:complete len:232 (-) Transcript_1095:145-840(-)